jgi:hypothetical protein
MVAAGPIAAGRGAFFILTHYLPGRGTHVNSQRKKQMKHVIVSFIAAMTVMSFMAEANAVVCAKGVVRAGCVSARGTVVARRPVARPVVVKRPVVVVPR